MWRNEMKLKKLKKTGIICRGKITTPGMKRDCEICDKKIKVGGHRYTHWESVVGYFKVKVFCTRVCVRKYLKTIVGDWI